MYGVIFLLSACATLAMLLPLAVVGVLCCVIAEYE